MKKYKYSFSKLIIILLVAVVALAAAGFAWNVYNIIALKDFNVLRVIYSAILILLCAALLLFTLGVAFGSFYRFDKDKIVLRLGLFKITYNVEDMTEISLFLKTKKLVVYLKNQKFVVIVIGEKDFDGFIDDLRKLKPTLVVDEKTEIDGEDEE